MKNISIFITTITLLIFASNGFGQQTYIPDDNFETALIELGYDSGMLNDSVATDSIAGIVELVISEKGIGDLTGIEDFTALEILWANNNDLISLDLSGNPNLIYLDLGLNDLSELDISQNPMLETIILQHNELTSFDISQNPNVLGLNLYSCNIAEMDLSQNTSLEWITLSGNDITEIDVSNNANLKELSIYTTDVAEVDVSQNPLLRRLNIFNTQITEVDVSQNPDLTLLNIRKTEISEIDVTQNPALYYLYMSETNISNVDISNNPLLHQFWIDNNYFQYPELEALFAADTYEQFKDGFKYAPQKWIGDPVDTTIQEGMSVVFEMTDYRAGSMDTIRWYRDGELLPGHNNTSLTLENTELSDAGYYYAKITSGVVPEIELESNRFKLTVDPNTGLDLGEHLNILVYPNPASDYIYVAGVDGVMKIKLFDEQGELVKEVEIDDMGRFSLEDCPTGIYFLHGMTNNGNKAVRKIMWE